MFDGQPHTIDHYTKPDGSVPFQSWFEELKNKQAAMSIDVRITRLQAGNAGNAKSVGGGVYELKIDLGKGYRVYFALSGERVVLLLCGGDKSTQASDIKTAKSYWADHQKRTK